MEWNTTEPQKAQIDGVMLEYACYGPPPGEAPTLMLLHEGLGCVALWRGFPDQIQQATGYGVFAYSRQGYGGSDPCPLPRPIDFMEREACDVVPKVLDAIGFQRGVLFGHSDGGTIAGLYLGNHQDHRVRGLIMLAPHFFCEPQNIVAIRDIRQKFEAEGLRDRLARYHGTNVDCAFYGWANSWMDPRFENWDVSDSIGYVRVPILYIQGRDDPYGSPAQADVVVAESYAPVDVHLLEDCKHSPQFEQTEQTIRLVSDYLARLDRFEAGKAAVA